MGAALSGGRGGGGAGGSGALLPDTDTFWGTGSSGDFVAGTATLASCGYYDRYEVPAGVVVYTANYAVFCLEAIIDGEYHNDGVDAVGSTQGTTTPTGAWGIANPAGGAVGTGNGFAGGSVVADGLGGVGGVGGDGAVGVGGAAGTVGLVSNSRGGVGVASLPWLASRLLAHDGAGSDFILRGGSGGGGGGGAGGGMGTPGAGGASGKPCLLFARDLTISSTGVISARGGNGAGAGAGPGDLGGGGGGGGGVVFIFCTRLSRDPAATITAAGGSGGSGFGGGTSGASGSAGVVHILYCQ